MSENGSRLTAHGSRTLMIMAGGTGGHIFPALSVAEYVRSQNWNVVWLGSPAGMEARIVAPKGYTMAWIRFSGVRRSGIVPLVTLPVNLLVALWQSARARFQDMQLMGRSSRPIGVYVQKSWNSAPELPPLHT